MGSVLAGPRDREDVTSGDWPKGMNNLFRRLLMLGGVYALLFLAILLQVAVYSFGGLFVCWIFGWRWYYVLPLCVLAGVTHALWQVSRAEAEFRGSGLLDPEVTPGEQDADS